MKIDNIETATSVARREGSDGFAIGGGDVSPWNSRLGQRQIGPEAEAAVMVQKAKRMEYGAKNSGIIIAKGWRTGPSGLEAAGCTSSEAYLMPQTKNLRESHR